MTLSLVNHLEGLATSWRPILALEPEAPLDEVIVQIAQLTFAQAKSNVPNALWKETRDTLRELMRSYSVDECIASLKEKHSLELTQYVGRLLLAQTFMSSKDSPAATAEALARYIAYMADAILKASRVIPVNDQLFWISGSFKKDGIYAYYLAPIHLQDGRAISAVIFRGTKTDSLQRDVEKGAPGATSFMKHQDQLWSQLLKLFQDAPGAPLLITGHSLGGTDAQHLLYLLIERWQSLPAEWRPRAIYLHTFNAPAVSQRTAEKFVEALHKLDTDSLQLSIFHNLRQNDFIQLASGVHLGANLPSASLKTVTLVARVFIDHLEHSNLNFFKKQRALHKEHCYRYLGHEYDEYKATRASEFLVRPLSRIGGFIPDPTSWWKPQDIHPERVIICSDEVQKSEELWSIDDDISVIGSESEVEVEETTSVPQAASSSSCLAFLVGLIEKCIAQLQQYLNFLCQALVSLASQKD